MTDTMYCMYYFGLFGNIIIQIHTAMLFLSGSTTAAGNVLRWDCLFISRYGAANILTHRDKDPVYSLTSASCFCYFLLLKHLHFTLPFIDHRAKYLQLCQHPPETRDNLICVLWTPDGSDCYYYYIILYYILYYIVFVHPSCSCHSVIGSWSESGAI